MTRQVTMMIRSRPPDLPPQTLTLPLPLPPAPILAPCTHLCSMPSTHQPTSIPVDILMSLMMRNLSLSTVA